MPDSNADAFMHEGHDHERCLDDAVVRAEELCRERGARLTPLRRQVLELVWSGHKPLGAYEILESLQAERGGAAPPTVYRALEFLRAHGLVHRIESLNAFVGCAEPDGHHGAQHGAQFLICRSCGAVAELSDDRITKAIRGSAEKTGFAIDNATIEIEGYCPHCQ